MLPVFTLHFAQRMVGCVLEFLVLFLHRMFTLLLKGNSSREMSAIRFDEMNMYPMLFCLLNQLSTRRCKRSYMACLSSHPCSSSFLLTKCRQQSILCIVHQCQHIISDQWCCVCLSVCLGVCLGSRQSVREHHARRAPSLLSPRSLTVHRFFGRLSYFCQYIPQSFQGHTLHL